MTQRRQTRGVHTEWRLEDKSNMGDDSNQPCESEHGYEDADGTVTARSQHGHSTVTA